MRCLAGTAIRSLRFNRKCVQIRLRKEYEEFEDDFRTTLRIGLPCARDLGGWFWSRCSCWTVDCTRRRRDATKQNRIRSEHLEDPSVLTPLTNHTQSYIQYVKHSKTLEAWKSKDYYISVKTIVLLRVYNLYSTIPGDYSFNGLWLPGINSCELLSLTELNSSAWTSPLHHFHLYSSGCEKNKASEWFKTRGELPRSYHTNGGRQLCTRV